MFFQNLLLCVSLNRVSLSSYNREGERIGEHEAGNREKGDILADMSTSFIIGIFFPSVTGMFLGGPVNIRDCFVCGSCIIHRYEPDKDTYVRDTYVRGKCPCVCFPHPLAL